MFDEGSPKDSATEEDYFERCRRAFEATVSGQTYSTWFEKAAICIDNYEGRQWGHLTDDDREYMRERKMVEITTNLIKPKIDNVTGQELKTRTKFKYAARSGDEKESLVAAMLSDVVFWLQDKNKGSRKMTLAAKNARITGVGWHVFRVKGKLIGEESVNPLNMVWDTRDGSEELTNLDFVAEYGWFSVETAVADYPDFAEELRGAATSQRFAFAGTWALENSRMLLQQAGGYYSKELDQVCIVKMRYRKPAKVYVTTTEEGAVVQAFSKADAEMLAAKKDDISELEGFQVFECDFCGSINLRHEASDIQLDPRTGQFLYTPIVYDMGRIDRVPIALVDGAIDNQRLYNRTSVKLSHLMAARQVIADTDAVADPAELEKQSASPDGIIFKKKGSELKFDRHEFEIQSATALMAQCEHRIEVSLGIYNESLGQETNAQSGIAIQRRQSGTNNTHAPFLDTLASAKQTIGMKAMNVVRSVLTDEMVFYITDDENASKVIRLNQPALDKNGNPLKDKYGKDIGNLDIRVGQYDLSVEEAPDVSSQSEESRMALQNLLSSGIGPEKWTPTLLEVMGISITQRKKFEAERQQLVREAQPPQPPLGGNPPAGPAGGVPGQLPINNGG